MWPTISAANADASAIRHRELAQEKRYRTTREVDPGIHWIEEFGSDCSDTVNDVEDGVALEAVAGYHPRESRVASVRDPKKVRTALEAILDRSDVTAPVRGHPIVSEDVPQHLETLLEAARRSAASTRFPRPRRRRKRKRRAD